MKESAPDDLSELSKDSHETSTKATHQKMSSHSPSIKLTRMIKTSSPPSKAARCEPTSRPERRIEKASASKAKLSQPDSHSRDGSMTWENGTNITKGEPVHTQGGVHKQRRTTPSGWVHLPVKQPSSHASSGLAFNFRLCSPRGYKRRIPSKSTHSVLLYHLLNNSVFWSKYTISLGYQVFYFVEVLVGT